MQQPEKTLPPGAGGGAAQRRGGMFLKDEGEQTTATERGEQPNATELEFSRDVSKQVSPDPSANRICQLEGSSPSW